LKYVVSKLNGKREITFRLVDNHATAVALERQGWRNEGPAGLSAYFLRLRSLVGPACVPVNADGEALF
jgi:hypothetical protein